LAGGCRLKQIDFEKDFKILTESLPQIFWICTPDGKNIYFNQLWADYTGMTLEESYEHGWNKPFHPNDQQKAWDAWQEAVKHGAIYSLECRLRRADGVYRWWHIRGVPVMGGLGVVTRWFGTCTDINDLKQAMESLRGTSENLKGLNISLEERIAKSVEELRQKDQMLILQDRLSVMGEMINNIAHQWNQPLNALGLIVQQLPFYYESETLTIDVLKQNTQQAMNLIQHMSQTINDFRNLFKVDKLSIPFNVNDVVIRTLSLIEKTFTDQGITIDLSVGDNPTVTGFPNEYSQVLLNILMNARDALAENNIEDARISIHTVARGGTSVVTVIDNGGAISADIISRLFDPYFTTKKPDKGTGIGLFMSKTIIEKNMGGRLSVRNTDNGAEFKIEI
jgi:PAS domain S-box-containing protein